MLDLQTKFYKHANAVFCNCFVAHMLHNGLECMGSYHDHHLSAIVMPEVNCGVMPCRSLCCLQTSRVTQPCLRKWSQSR